jgi:hypothetical protein
LNLLRRRRRSFLLNSQKNSPSLYSQTMISYLLCK